MYRPAPPLTPTGRKLPEKFGRYLLVERIGSGGMAEVFRAVTFGWEGFRRVIVIKRVRREHTESPNFLSMFFDEAKISALLHHPNIVQVYDFGHVEGSYFLAMEHIDGRDLGAVLRALRGDRRAFPPSLVAFIGHEVAQGLSYAHTLVSADGTPFDIVHRDINPSNVMLLRTGGVKILDFGIAKASEAAGKTQTQRAMVKGKLSYLSPEQARCVPLDARSDLFSLGSTLWGLLTGHRLFGGQSDFDRVNAVKHAEITAPSRHANVPEALDRIVMRALQRDVDLRYQSAAEMAADFDSYLKRFPPEPDAVGKLLLDLFGEESSRNLALPLDDSGAHGAGARRAATPTTGAEAAIDGDATEPSLLPSPDGPAARYGGRGAQRRAVVWTSAAALAVAALSAILWTLHAGPVDPRALPAPSLAAPSPAGPAPGEAALVAIDVDSEPAGAAVSDRNGLLGTTPLTLRLPSSLESAELRFEKPGYEPATYEVRPRSAGAVFVELRRAKQ